MSLPDTLTRSNNFPKYSSNWHVMLLIYLDLSFLYFHVSPVLTSLSWMTSLMWWTWVCVGSGSWWWTGRHGMLWFMGSQSDTTETELNRTEHPYHSWDPLSNPYPTIRVSTIPRMQKFETEKILICLFTD